MITSLTFASNTISLLMNDARENLLFIDALRVTIKKDHNDRVAQKLEARRFSRSNFDTELEKAYPQVGTGELLSTAKKSADFLRKNPASNKKMSSEKVDGLLKFLFKNKNGSNMPTVVQLVKTFGNGKFAHYAENIKTIEQSESEKILTALDRVSDSPPHLNALRLFVELSLKHYSESANQMNENKKTISELRAVLRKVVGQLSKKEMLTSEDEEVIKAAKNV